MVQSVFASIHKTDAENLDSTLFLAIATSIDAVTLGYFATLGRYVERDEIAASVLRLALDLFMLALSMRLVAINETNLHWEYICHISALTSLAACLRAISLLLPTHPFDVNILDQSNGRGLEYASLAFIVAACCISITTRSGPPLHYRPERIYSPKMLESFKDVSRSEDNVCAVVQASVLDSLLFSYTTAVANLAHTSESLEVRDLPIVPAGYRAANLFAKMRLATVQDEEKRSNDRMERRLHGKKSSRQWFWQKEGSGFPLITRLVRINKTPLLAEAALAGVTAIFYYIPLWYDLLNTME